MAIRGGTFKPIFLIFALISFTGSRTAIFAQEAAAASSKEVASSAEEGAASAGEEVLAVEDAPVAREADEFDYAAAEGAPIEVEEDAVDVKIDASADEAEQATPVAEEETAPADDGEAAGFVDELPVARAAVDDEAKPIIILAHVDEMATAESAEAEAPASEDVPEIVETYAVPDEVLNTHVLSEGDAFTLTCFAVNERHRKFPPLLKYRPKPNVGFHNLYTGISPRPDIPDAIYTTVTPVVEGHLYHYNFHAAKSGISGEYECDYTVDGDDLVYHVIVLKNDSITCPAGGSVPDQQKISEVECSIKFEGFFPSGVTQEPSLILKGAELPSATFLPTGDLLSVVAEDVLVERTMVGERFKCIFPLTSATLSLSCESDDPLEVTWEPTGSTLKAPDLLIKGEEYNVTCEVKDLGNPPTEVELYAVGDDRRSTLDGNVATLTYVEEEMVAVREFVCRTRARATELSQAAEVAYGPARVRSTSTDTADMLEGTLYAWECFEGPSHPPAEVEYLLCVDPANDETCQNITTHRMFADRVWDGKYLKCAATNPKSRHRVESQPHLIDVQYTPSFLGSEANKDILVRKGKPFTLNCEHEGNPDNLVYAWEKEVFDEEDAVILNRRRRHEHHEHAEHGEHLEHGEAAAAPTPVVIIEEAVEVAAAATSGPSAPVEVSVEGAPASKAAEEELEVEADAAAEPAPDVVASLDNGAVDDVPEAKGASEDDVPVEEAPTQATTGKAVEESETTEENVILPVTTAPLPDITTARPLRPSVDLSEHNATTFVVGAAEPKHFGSYLCRATNKVGVSQIRYTVREDTSPIKPPVKPSKKPPVKPSKKPSGKDSATLLRSPSAAIFATLISLFFLFN